MQNNTSNSHNYPEALSINPNHVGSTHYMGKLFVKLNQMDQAKSQLSKLEKICGVICPEFIDLKNTIAAAATGKNTTSECTS